MSPTRLFRAPDLLHELARSGKSATRRSALDALAIDAAIRVGAPRTPHARSRPHAGQRGQRRVAALHPRPEQQLDHDPGPRRPGRGPARGRGRHGQPGLRRLRRHLRVLLGGAAPRLDRRPGHADPRHGALRHRVQQRVLGRRGPHVVRRRRRQAVLRLHQEPRRHRARAHPRRHPVHGQPRLQRPVRRAERVALRRVRLARQAVRAQPDRRPGRLAHRRRTSSGRSSRPRCAR